MDEKQLFTKFWNDESETTRKVLARIPEGSDYRPDPRSRTAQEIAWQIVCEEKMIIDALERGQAEWAPPPMPASMKDVVNTYERQSARIAERWKALPAERWNVDEYYDADAEEGEVMQVFRSRERAEAECADMNGMTRDIWSHEIGEAEIEFDEDDESEYGMFDMQERLRWRRGLLPGEKLKRGEGIFQTTAGVPFYEVIEVSLEGLE